MDVKGPNESEMQELRNQGIESSLLEQVQIMSQQFQLSQKECLKWIKIAVPRVNRTKKTNEHFIKKIFFIFLSIKKKDIKTQMN